MKKFTSLALVAFCFSQIQAQTNFEYGKPKSNLGERKIKPLVEKPHIHSVKEALLSRDQLLENSLKVANQSANNIQYRSQTNTQTEKLDSLITTNSNGGYYSKQIFSYNEDNFFTKSENFFWNYDTSSWDLVQIYQYDYDESNNLIAQIQKEFIYYSGSKTEFIYNDQNQVISTRFANLTDDEVYYQERLDHQYLNGNIVREDFYQSVNGADQWVNTFFGIAAYDELNRQTDIEQYIIENGQNVGLSKGKYEYYLDTNLNTLYENYEWSSNNTWFPNQRIEQSFDNNYITEQKLLAWNYNLNNWTGDQTHKTIFTYDDQWRQTSEIAYFLNQADLTTYDQKVSIISTYTPGENATTVQQQQIFERVNGTDYLRSKLFKHYNNANNLVYRKELNIQGNSEMPLYEEVYEYNANNNLVTFKNYNFEGQTRIASFRYDQVFDQNNNLTRYTAFNGSGNDTWDDFVKYEYQNIENFRSSTLGYMKQNGQWNTNFGNSIEVDTNVQISQLVLPTNFPAPYKVLNTKNYNTDGGTGWLIDNSEFYYSLLDNLNVNDVATTKFKVYPNPTSDFIYIDSENVSDVKIYDLTGKMLLKSNSNKINIQKLKPGIYLVRIDGFTVKIIKK